MCMSIDQYRAAVGLYNAKMCIRRCTRVSFMPQYICRILMFISMLLPDGLFLNMCFVVFIVSLLVTCGDIEPNPGPVPGDQHSIDTDSTLSMNSTLNSLIDSTFCTIVHLNVRSLLSSIDQISVELNEFDIIALSETFLNDTIDNSDIDIAGYCEPFRMDRNRHGGGVCIYVKSTLHAERCYEYEDNRMECIWLKITSTNKTFYFACAYRPPNSNEFWQALSQSIEKVKDNDNPNIFIFGDLNSDISNSRSKIHEFIETNNLSQVITEPTRIPSNSIIDVILTNAPLMIISNGVLDPLCSDHKPIYARLNYNRHRLPVYKRLIWDFNNTDFDTFRMKLEETNWENLLTNIVSLDECVHLFTKTFIDIAKTYINNKTVTIRNRDKPWLHNEIRKQIRIRKRMHKSAKRFNTPDHWNLFKHQRNKVVGLIRNAKQAYYRHLSGKMSSPGSISSKEWWKLCKFLYTGKCNDHSIPQLTIDNNIVFKDVDKAEAFNDYFNSISQVIDANAAIDEPIIPTDYELSNIIISCQDVKDVLLNRLSPSTT